MLSQASFQLVCLQKEKLWFPFTKLPFNQVNEGQSARKQEQQPLPPLRTAAKLMLPALKLTKWTKLNQILTDQDIEFFGTVFSDTSGKGYGIGVLIENLNAFQCKRDYTSLDSCFPPGEGPLSSIPRTVSLFDGHMVHHKKGSHRAKSNQEEDPSLLF